MISLIWYILSPIFIGILLYIIKIKYYRIILIIFQIAFFRTSLSTFLKIKNTGQIREKIGNYVDGVGIALYADNIAIVLVMLTIFLFTIMFIVIYNKSHLNKLFIFLFLSLQGLINGVFLADDLFNIYILIEVSTIVISILIMFKKDKQSIYDGMTYLLTNVVAMSFFLFGVGYLYKIFGTLSLDLISKYINEVDPRALVLPYSFIITAVALKSAIMPLFSWLPRAHATSSAPSEVSAILSGLYVKTGIYLFIRINGVFGQVINVGMFFLVVGVLTAVIGIIITLSQTDLKLILAYSTVSQLGLILYSICIPARDNYYGSVYKIINHAIAKSTLFLCVGIIIYAYQTVDIKQIKGVFKKLPLTSIVIILAIVGVTGGPFFNGSISKYYILNGYKGSVYELIVIIINLGTILTFIKFSTIFFGSSEIEKVKLRFNRKISLIILGLTCLIGGIFGTEVLNYLFDAKLSVDYNSYVYKSIFYFINILIAYFIYKFTYNKISFISKLKSIELSFNEIVLSIVIFFGTILAYTNFVAI